MSNSSATLGGASANLLRQITEGAEGMVSDNDPVQWDPDWHDRFETWRLAPDNRSSIILVFSTKPAVLAGKVPGCVRMFQFGMLAVRPEPGVYIVGRTVYGNAWRVPGATNDYQALCQQLEALNLGNQTCVVLGNSTSAALLLPHGVLGADVSAGIILPHYKTDSPLDDEILSAELKHFADNVLAAEDLRKTMWVKGKASQFWPIELAEKTIQTYLLIALRSTFKRYDFLDETRVTPGHIDIFILPKSNDEAGRAVLELKAIRQYGSTGKSVSTADALKHLQGGMDQALTYVEDATNKYLCAYDMRKVRDQTLLDEAKAGCDAVGVSFRAYEVFESATAVRESKAKAMKALLSTQEN